MKRRNQLFLGIIFFFVLPDSALADMMQRTTYGDMIFFLLKVIFCIAFAVSFILWVITHLLSRKPEVRRRSGYTVIGLGGALCLVILLGKIYYHYLGYGAYKNLQTKKRHTIWLFQEIKIASQIYGDEHGGQYPANEEQLIGALSRKGYDYIIKDNIRQGVLVDDWGTPFEITFKGIDVVLHSAGPDRKFNTKDDLSNADYYKRKRELEKAIKKASDPNAKTEQR
jgi:hypothetical protein